MATGGDRILAGALSTHAATDGGGRAYRDRGKSHGPRPSHTTVRTGPYTAIRLENLSGLLLQQGETEAATELLEHAYAVYLGKLGPAHPYTRDLGRLLKKED